MRQSQFELIRIIAQLFIVMYHIYFFFIYNITENPFDKAIWLPLHVGVLLFIMISGWFRIKTSIKGFFKLITMIALLYFPLEIIWHLKHSISSGFELATTFSFISWSPFWFIRTYVFLYLLAPVINSWLDKSSINGKLYLIIVLFFISHYIGSWGSDATLADGKNVITFSFLYVLGALLHEYKQKIGKIHATTLWLTYLIYNTVIVYVFSHPDKIPGFDFIFNKGFYSYCSIGQLINALLLFILLSRLQFHSKLVNIAGGASLSIYMIHCSDLILYNLISPVIQNIIGTAHITSLYSEGILFFKVLLVAIVIIIICILLHYILSPIATKLSSLITDFIAKIVPIHLK